MADNVVPLNQDCLLCQVKADNLSAYGTALAMMLMLAKGTSTLESIRRDLCRFHSNYFENMLKDPPGHQVP